MNRRIVEHPWLTIALFALATAVLAARIPELVVDPDVHSMMASEDPEFLYNEWLEEHFGIEDPVLLMVIDDGPNGVFNPETLALVERLSHAIGEHPGIDNHDLRSLSEVDDITGDDDVLVVEPFFEEAPTTQDEASAIRDRVFANRMMLGSLVSRDGRATLIVAEPAKDYDKSTLYRDLREILAATPLGSQRVLIAGRPVLEGELGHLANLDLAQMFPLVLFAAASFLLLSLRSLRGILLPLLVVVSSVVWTLGLMAWLGATFFAINTIMPVLLVAIGVASGIHIIHDFLLGLAEAPERPVREIVFDTMQRLTPPLVMSALTTAGGIGSLAVSQIRPLQGFGLFTSAGVLAGLLFSLTILPAILCLLPPPLRAAQRAARSQSEKGGLVATFLDTLTPLVVRRPLLAIGGASLLILFGVAGIPRVFVDASMLQNFPPTNPVKVADEEIRTYFGGTQPMQIVLDGGAEDAWKVPENLRAMEGLQRHILAAGHASETRSIADFVSRMNEVMNPDDPDAYRIPDRQDLVAQYLLLYSLSGEPDDFEDVVDFDYRMANVRIQLVSDSSPAIGGAIESIEAYAAEHLAPLGIDTHVSGTGRIIYGFIVMIVEGQIYSLVLGILIVILLTAIMNRSFTAGLFTVIPVAVATVLNFGLLGWLEEPLSVTTGLLSSMGIGIGVDYAIHFVFRYRQGRRAGLAPEAVMRDTLKTSGVAIFYNALVVLAGFLVLATSEFPPNHVLGLLVSLNMFVCFVGTVTLLAAALHRIQPAFVRPVVPASIRALVPDEIPDPSRAALARRPSDR